MPKPSHREKLLTAGLQVVLERGYCGASVRDIVQAAGVPQGSFTNHFRSKEAFCLEVLERYFDLVRQNIEKTLRHDATAPLERMRCSLHASFQQQVNILRRQFLQDDVLPFTDVLTEEVIGQALTAISG